MELILKPLLEHGLSGIIIAALLYWVWKLQGQIQAQHTAHITDLKAAAVESRALVVEVHQTVSALERYAEAMDGRAAQRQHRPG